MTSPKRVVFPVPRKYDPDTVVVGQEVCWVHSGGGWSPLSSSVFSGVRWREWRSDGPAGGSWEENRLCLGRRNWSVERRRILSCRLQGSECDSRKSWTDSEKGHQKRLIRVSPLDFRFRSSNIFSIYLNFDWWNLTFVNHLFFGPSYSFESS